MTDPWTILRVIDVFLFGAVLTGIIMHASRLTSWHMPGFRWGLWIFFAGTMWATIRAALLHLPGGSQLVFIFAGLAIMTYACYVRAAQKHWRMFRARTESARKVKVRTGGKRGT